MLSAANKALMFRWGGRCAVATGVAIPVSTAGTSVLIGLTVLMGLASGVYARHWRPLLNNPLSRSALVLFAWLSLGLLYTEAPLDEAIRYLMKYRDLLMIPLFLPFFTHPDLRRGGLWAFFGVNLLILFASCGDGVWQLMHNGAIHTDPEVFLKRITQGLLLAFTAYWTYLRMETNPGERLPYASLLLLIGVNLFILVSGRTGQVLFLALAALALLQHYGWRGISIAVAGGAAILILAYAGSEPFRLRVAESQAAMADFQHNDFTSSTARRISYYPNSMELIMQRPLFGHGTGSFTHLYASQVQGTPYPLTANPHNSFLLLGVEGGIVAILLFVHLLFQQWRSGRRLPETDFRLLQGFLLIVVLDSILNSFLRDSIEGHLYAYFSALLFAPLIRDRIRP